MGRRHYVPMRSHHDIPIRRPEDVPLRRRWVFHLRRTCDVTETYRETSLQRRHDVLIPGGQEVYYHFLFPMLFYFITIFTVGLQL